MMGKKIVLVSAFTLVSLGSLMVVAADGGAPQATSTMAEFMNRMIRPSSDVVFYVASEAPASDEAWRRLEDNAFMLAESANLLLIPGYARESERWRQDTALMREAALAAFEAAKNKNVALLEELGNTLYESCESCHTATR